MSWSQIKLRLQQGDIAPVYSIIGTESYLQCRFSEEIVRAVELKTNEKADLTRIDLNEDSLMQIVDEADMFSFFSEYRVIIVENAHLMTNAKASQHSDAAVEAVIQYLLNPNPNSVLIFKFELESLDKRRKLSKVIEGETLTILANPMTEREIRQYLNGYLKNATFTLTRDAQTVLLERVDYQLSGLMSELQKLESYAHSNQQIGVDVIRNLVPRTLESDVFELTQAILNRHADTAVQIYEDLLLQQHSPIALHALIVSQFRLFIQVKILSMEGHLEGDIAKRLNVHPYRVKLARQYVRGLDLSLLTTSFTELAQIDYEMKTGYGHQTTHFYLWLMKYMQRTK